MTPSDATIRRVLQSGNPLVEGNRVTFFWEWDFAPHLIGDVTDWEERPKPFKRVPLSSKFASDKTIWSCSLTIPRDAYVEYAFYNPLTPEKILDPLNGQTVANGLGSRNNFFYMPESMPSPFSLRRADVRTGTITRHRVGTDLLQDDGERDVYLYKPP